MHKSRTLVFSLPVVLLFLASVTHSASAQVPKGNVFFGYSYENTAINQGDKGSLNGWDASLEGKLIPWIGLVADVDGHYGSRTYPVVCHGGGICSGGANIAEHNFLFGPRVSVTVKGFRPFAEILVGAAHVSRTSGISDSNTSFANAVGGGLDYKAAGPIWLRAQLDWVEDRFYGNTQNGVRFSTGIAIHF